MSKPGAGSPVACFASVTALRDALDAKTRFEPVDLYPRDGCVLLHEVEARLGKLIGIAGDSVVAYNSGMSAVVSVLDTALNQVRSTRPVLAFSEGLYKQTRHYIEHYVGRRNVALEVFDNGSPEDVERLFGTLRPDIVLTESVSNFLQVSVLDIDHLLQLQRDAAKQPVLVIDNTLPLSTGLPLADTLTASDRVIVVESGTKSYSFNRELLGIAYSKQPALVTALRRYRRTVGTIPNGAGLEQINAQLPKSKTAFDDRNRRLFETTKVLAQALHEAGERNSRSANFEVRHPALVNHANHRLYERQLPDGGVPVFFIESAASPYELAGRLWDHPGVRRHAVLGQSFGFDETRILADESIGGVRIAGGAETDADKLAAALKEAVSA